MDRDCFIHVLEACITSATGRQYPHIDWEHMSDKGLIECAEMVRDLLDRRAGAEIGESFGAEAVDGNLH